MTHFCTLFDSFYLNRGLVMYQSLKENCADFHLYIFPFDEVSLELLKKLNLEGVTLVSLSEFENPGLLEVKKTRTKGEYCWTCTSSIIDYCLVNFNLPHCTYVDADLRFYGNPVALLEEMKDQSILITDHRYTARYDQSNSSGTYCVQFITFRNNEEGRAALHWWRDRCLEWCFARFEDGKFGDQKYLDDWPTRFTGVHSLQHLGGGVAPWNVQQYRLFKTGPKWFLQDKKSRATVPLIFFHFHYVKFFDDGTINLSDIYDLGYAGVLNLYKEYVTGISQINTELLQKFNFEPRTAVKPFRSSLYKFGKKIYNRYQRVHGLYNNMKMSAFIK